MYSPCGMRIVVLEGLMPSEHMGWLRRKSRLDDRIAWSSNEGHVTVIRCLLELNLSRPFYPKIPYTMPPSRLLAVDIRLSVFISASFLDLGNTL